MAKLTRAERDYLILGKKQQDGKLPLFDDNGQMINFNTVKSCLDKGLTERWFISPMRPDWPIYRLTDAGYEAI